MARTESAAVSVLAAAFRDGAVARWLEPDEQTRHRLSEGYFSLIVRDVLAGGQVAVVTTDDGPSADRRYDGVGLWMHHPRPGEEPGEASETATSALPLPPDVAERLGILREMLDARRPVDAHAYLAYLAVHPTRQGRGIGSALLARRHAVLDVIGEPAYLEADDPRNRDLYLRHGYVDDDPIHLPDGPPLWPMWRAPSAGPH
jgi:GNAT superfamily N-acetyltransferase